MLIVASCAVALHARIPGEETSKTQATVTKTQQQNLQAKDSSFRKLPPGAMIAGLRCKAAARKGQRHSEIESPAPGQSEGHRQYLGPTN